MTIEFSTILSFSVWTILSFGVVIYGVKQLKRKTANHTIGYLWFGAGAIGELLGLPLVFCKQNSPLFLFSVIGIVILVLGTWVIYTKIEKQ